MSDLENREGEIVPEDEAPETITMYGPVDTSKEEDDTKKDDKEDSAQEEKAQPRFIDKLPLMSPFVRTIVRLGSTLLAIAVTVALLLSLVNGVTSAKIASEKARATDEGMRAVLPTAEAFEKTNFVPRGTISAISLGTAGGAPVGYAVSVSPIGFGGPISMIVGITNGEVTGVKVVSLTETPGLGTHAQDAAFTDQFKGKKGKLSVVKNGAPKESEISAISGATITSSAVTAGVSDALSAVTELKKGAADAGGAK